MHFLDGGGLRLVAAAGLVLVATYGSFAAGCAASVSPPDEEGGGGATSTSTSTGTGGTGGTTMGTGGAGVGGMNTSLCAQDCSTIAAPDCYQAVCNEGRYPGTIGACVVVPVEDGEACDDGQFCTVNDTCQAGVCTGGPQNDCGMSPPDCTEVVCNESTQSCSTAPANNGSPCQTSDLCVKGSTCSNGNCVGGAPDDCFFFPVPDECHVAVCDPSDGMCKPQPGNDGGSCTYMMDLCAVNNTCSNGVCNPGPQKDCSQLTVGCNLGVCDNTTGACVQQAVMNGGLCDDLDACTTGETCNAGQCNGGTAITNCIDNDACCPMGCDETNDTDCSCNINLALSATATSSGGGSNSTGYGPANWNDGVDEADCQSMLGCTQCQGWINGSTSPNGGFYEYDWTAPVQIGSLWVDTSDCNLSGQCNNSRSVGQAEVQWWDGAQWITAGTITNQPGDFGFTFPQKVTTTKLRLYNVATACGSNPLMYEWYVWAGSACMP
ncbi:MAG: hypothetical protein R3B72_25480 [Polyangiaceae bacterium]